MTITHTYIMLIALWAGYFVLHSVLAANAVKKVIQSLIPAVKPYYRIGFNVIAVGLLLPLAKFTLQVEDVELLDSQILNIAGGVVMAVGVVTMYFAFRSFNVKEFLGFAEEHTHTGSTELVRSGMYGLVRHPLYFAVIIIFVALFLLMPTLKILLVDIVVFAYLVIGSKLEEDKLIEEFGNAYKQYQKEVKGLLPYVY